MFKATSSRRGRHRLERTVLGRTRKGRITRIVSATAIAGVLAGGITLAAAPANANPATCPVPTSATWHVTGVELPYAYIHVFLRTYTWATTYNGVNYVGETHTLAYTPTTGPAGVCAPVGQPLPPLK